MSVKMSDLAKETRQLTIQLKSGDELNVTYRPGAMTPLVEESMHSAIREKMGGRAVALPLSSLLVSWDVVDEAGEPVPASMEVLSLLPTEFLSEVMAAIGEDMNPNRKKSEGSFAS